MFYWIYSQKNAVALWPCPSFNSFALLPTDTFWALRRRHNRDIYTGENHRVRFMFVSPFSEKITGTFWSPFPPQFVDQWLIFKGMPHLWHEDRLLVLRRRHQSKRTERHPVLSRSSTFTSPCKHDEPNEHRCFWNKSFLIKIKNRSESRQDGSFKQRFSLSPK